MTTEVNTDRYNYYVKWSSETGEYVGLCTEFPVLVASSLTQQEAFYEILSKVNAHVSNMLAKGLTPPEPLSEREYSGKFMVRIPPSQHRLLVKRAESMGISLNALVNQLLAE